MDYPFQWGAHRKLLIAASQSADCRNRLAPILLIEGISFPRNATEIVVLCQFLQSANSESLLLLQITEPVSSAKSYMQRLPFWILISYIFWIKPLEPFSNLESKFPFKFKDGKGRPFYWYHHFRPLLTHLGRYLQFRMVDTDRLLLWVSSYVCTVKNFWGMTWIFATRIKNRMCLSHVQLILV